MIPRTLRPVSLFRTLPFCVRRTSSDCTFRLPLNTSPLMRVERRQGQTKIALSRLALLRSASFRTALLRFASLKFAPLRSASFRTAPLRFASLKFASVRFASLRSAPLRSAPQIRLAQVCVLSLTFASPSIPIVNSSLE
jgi:hypothetical protein